MIGSGCVTKLTFSWGGNPGVGSLQRFRDAVENQWPHPLEIEEHSHAGMATRYAAGAAGLPFGILRGYIGTDLPKHTSTIKTVECPFTGEVLAAVPAINPDVGIIHAQRADRAGNVQIWGLLGVQKEAVLASTAIDRDRRGDRRRAAAELPGAIVLPSWVVSAVCHVPRGAHPSFAMGFSVRDNSFYKAWDPISKDRDAFIAWIDKHIMGTADFAEYCESVGI